LKVLPKITFRSTSALAVEKHFTDVVDTSLIELWKAVRKEQLLSSEGTCPSPALTEKEKNLIWGRHQKGQTSDINNDVFW